MYRNDQDALLARIDSLTKESEGAEQMRAELLELRRSLSIAPTHNPYLSFASVGAGEKAALARHSLEHFPVWAVALLHLISFGLSSLILFGIQHSRMPRAAYNDPSAGQAIGFQFIPFFNLYWIFFSPMRLADRVELQYRLRGEQPDGVPKALFLSAAILNVIPYLGILSLPTLWLLASCFMQARINRLVEMGDQTALPAGQPPRPALP
jgi:hypothetical protein